MQDQLGQPQQSDQKSFMTMFVMSLAFMFLWMQVAPRLFPGLFPQRKPIAEPVVEVPPVDPQELPKLQAHPPRTVELGAASDDYYVRAKVTSRGGALEWVELTDPRYTTLDRKAPLRVIGNNLNASYPGGVSTARSFETVVDIIEQQLKPHGQSLATVDWELVSADAENAVVRYSAPDGKLAITKSYHIHKAPADQRDGLSLGYLVDLSINLENTSEAPVECTYSLRGPTGVVIENEHNARTFLEAKVGTLRDPDYPDSVTSIVRSAATIVSQYDKSDQDDEAVDVWRETMKYAGIDAQFFTAVLMPKEAPFVGEGDARHPYFAEITPVVVTKTKLPERSDVGLMLKSSRLSLAPGKSETHNLQVYFGPKRKELLEPLGAYAALDHGWFARIMAGMLWLLKFFRNTFHVPYGIAIIMLTCVVRFCMFPLSRLQTRNQNKMTKLQPKLQELQAKYKDDQLKFLQVQREFFAKYDYNPYMGCVLMMAQVLVLQMPIFIALYNALYYAVDLRLEQFLWIKNLAAPDETIPFSFEVPFLKWRALNILPIINVTLFLVQQKMTMPPPTSEEQAMQQKMMNIMTVVFGVMFYKVPAGLCIYFIASSIWGILERKYLERLKGQLPSLDQIEQEAEERARQRAMKPIVIETTGTTQSSGKARGFWDQLLAAADQAKQQSDSTSRKDK